MKSLLVLTLAAALTGCAGGPLQGIAGRAGQLSDMTLDQVDSYLCELARVGAVKRRYGTSPELAAAYSTLCNPALAAGLFKHPVEKDTAATPTADDIEKAARKAAKRLGLELPKVEPE